MSYKNVNKRKKDFEKKNATIESRNQIKFFNVITDFRNFI